MKEIHQKGKRLQFHRLTLVTALACAMGNMAVAQTTADNINSPASVVESASSEGNMAVTQTTADNNNPSAAVAKKSASSEMALEEIIVTAEKREVPLQETPIAVTAITPHDLDNARISNLMNLANIAPSVTIVPFTGNRSAPNLFIRGMGGTDIQTTKDGATGIYVDGVLLARGTGLGADIADLERVEVLRGPQGTLYGRNTTAGAINFITRKPGKDFSFQQELDVGNYDLFSSRTLVNVPLSDNLYTRFAYSRSSNDGWVKNTNSTLPNQTNFNQDKKEALKWAFRLLATDNLTLDFSLDNSKQTYGNLWYQRIEGPTAFDGRQEETPAVKGLSPSDVSTGGENLTLTWDLGSAVLKSITAHRKVDSFVDQNYADLFTQTSKEHETERSQEFQLVGDALSKRINYVAGLFYFKEDSDYSVFNAYSPTLIDTSSVKASSKSVAVYGQATWRPEVMHDRLGLTLGLRNTKDTRDATKTFISSGFNPGSDGTVVPASASFTKTTPALTVDYAFTKDINGYAKYSTGYRAGGFNARSTVAGFGNGFGPETVKAYEVGLKSDLLDRRLRVNVAAFLNKYSDLQVDQVRVPATFTDTVNAGNAKVKGIEFEVKAMLTKGLTANLFYSYLDGEYGSYVDNGVELKDVKHMPFVPKGQGGLGLEYSPGSTAYGKLIFNLDYKWQTQWYSGPNPNTLTDGYYVWNGRVQLADIPLAKGTARVAIWARNLTDEKYRLATTNLGILSAQYGQPRTVGLNLLYDF